MNDKEINELLTTITIKLLEFGYLKEFNQENFDQLTQQEKHTGMIKYFDEIQEKMNIFTQKIRNDKYIKGVIAKIS